MKKFLSLLFLMVFAIGTAWAAETVVYTLDGTITGGSNGYATDSEITQSSMTWIVVGNTTMNPWRIGGKNLDGTDREVYSTTSMPSAISKVSLELGTATATVNSLKLTVASDANFSNVIDEINATFTENSTTDFTPSTGTEWTTGAYYKFTFNVTAGGSNQYVQFVGATFYKNDGDTPTPTTYNVNIDQMSNGSVTANPTKAAAEATVTLTVTPDTGYELDNIAVAYGATNVTLTTVTEGAKYTFTMPESDVIVSASFKESGDTPTPGNYTWELVNASALATGDVVVIADKAGLFAMSNDKGTGAAPVALTIVLNGNKNQIMSPVESNMQWTVNVTNDGLQFATGSDYLYCTNSNNGVRVGSNSNNIFTVGQGSSTNTSGEDYLYNVGTSRFIGVYNSVDWRCYTSDPANNNIKDTRIAFFKRVPSGDTPPVVTVNPPTFDPAAGKVVAGTVVTITGEQGTTITYTTDGTDPVESSTALTVDGNVATVTVNEPMTIKAVAMDADLNTSEVAEAAYTIKAQPTGDYVFYESFDDNEGTGGNDDLWSGQIASATTVVYDNEGWTAENAYAANQCIKLGAGSKLGTAETPAIALTSGQTYTLTFKAAAWNSANEKTTLNLSATGATLSEESIELVKGEWSDYSIVVTATDANANIKWEASNASSNRFFLDEVLLVEGGTMPVVIAAPTFDPAAGEVAKGTVVTITGAEGTTITYTTDGTDPVESSTALTVDGNVATVTVNAAMTIKAVAMDGDLNTSEVAEAAYTIAAVTVAPPTFDPAAGKVVAGTVVTITGEEGTTITYTTDGTDPVESSTALTVDGNVATVTVNEPMTIKAVAMDGDLNTSEVAEAAYTIKAQPTGDYVFYESFDDNEGTGGNDDLWSGNIASANLVADNEGWTFVSGKGANQCAKFGTGSAQGSAETPEITLTEGQTYTLTFKAAAWENDKETTGLNLSATGATLSESSIDLAKGEWTDYTIVVSATDAAATIKWEAVNSANNRFFLDEVLLVEGGTMPIVVPAPTFDPAAGEVAAGTVVTITGEEGTTITYTTDGTDPVESETALTVDGNVATVTVNEAMTIKAVAMDGDLNMSEVAEAAYTIKSEPIGDYVFYESFDGTEGTGGNDGQWNGNIATSTIVYDNEGWTAVSTGGGFKCIRVGTSKLIGSAETPGITLNEGQTYTLTFKAAAWLNDRENTTISLSATGATLSEESIELVKGEWTDYSVVLTATDTVASLKWQSINEGSNRFFLDEVLLVEGGTMPVIVPVPTFDPAAGEVAKGTVVTITGAEGTTITYTTDGTDPVESETALTVDGNVATVTINEAMTIKAVAMDGDLNMSKVAEAAYTIAVVTVAPPTFDPAAGRVAAGTVVTITGEEGTTITYTTDGTDPVESETALTVDGNVATVTVNEAMTIKAVAMDADLNMSEVVEAAYTIKAQPTGDYIFYESFDGTEGAGGNDDLWSGQIASGTPVYDNEGWTVENVYGANQCIKLGAGSKLGTAETPEIELEAGKTYTLTFMAAAWNTANEKTTINLSATGATLSEESVELVKGAWSDYTVTVTATDATATIKWEASNASNNRFFLDEVLVVKDEPQFQKGDVNGDGIVSGADVTALYNVLLDDATAGGDADVNGDGIVSGSDVTALYNILLN